MTLLSAIHGSEQCQRLLSSKDSGHCSALELRKTHAFFLSKPCPHGMTMPSPRAATARQLALANPTCSVNHATPVATSGECSGQE